MNVILVAIYIEFNSISSYTPFHLIKFNSISSYTPYFFLSNSIRYLPIPPFILSNSIRYQPVSPFILSNSIPISFYTPFHFIEFNFSDIFLYPFSFFSNLNRNQPKPFLQEGDGRFLQ